MATKLPPSIPLEAPARDPLELLRLAKGAEDLKLARDLAGLSGTARAREPMPNIPDCLTLSEKLDYAISALAGNLVAAEYKLTDHAGKEHTVTGAQRLVSLFARRTLYNGHVHEFKAHGGHKFAAYLLDSGAHGLETPQEMQLHLKSFKLTPDEVLRERLLDEQAREKRVAQVSAQAALAAVAKAPPSTPRNPKGDQRRGTGGGSANTPAGKKTRAGRAKAKPEEDEFKLPFQSGASKQE